MATILHLTTVHPRSDSRIHYKEAQTLASRLPHKVLLIVADGQGNVDAENGQVSIHDLGRLRGSRFARMLFGLWRAFFAIRKIKPDTVHFHDPELLPVGLLLKLSGYKVIYDVHENIPLQILSKYWLPRKTRKPIAWVMRGLEWFAYKAFNAIVPATPKIADRFPAFKTVTIQNFPIVSEILCPVPIPYLERPQSFAYVGEITESRGAVEMVRALELLDDVPGAKLDMAGTISPQGLANTLRVLPGWALVNYHGLLSKTQVAQLLGGARAGFVVLHPAPNHIDAQPIKMFEYMAASIPVIASDFPLWRQIIEGAGCGLLVDPMNPETIYQAMRWVLDHPAAAMAMGRRGRQAVERTYNWDSEASKIIGLYNTLLAS